MDLRTFIFESGITVSRVARELGVSISHIAAIAKKKRQPSREMAARISEFTRGLVSVSDLIAVQPKEDSLKEYLDKHRPISIKQDRKKKDRVNAEKAS